MFRHASARFVALRDAAAARWSARFAADLKSVARPKFYRGVVVVHPHTTTVYLVDERGCTVDKRSGGGFGLSPGTTVAFPCHVAHIEENITGGGMHRETATKKLWLVGEQLRWRKDSDRDQVRRFHTPPSSPCLPRLPPWSFELVTEMVEISEEKMRMISARRAAPVSVGGTGTLPALSFFVLGTRMSGGAG